MEELFKTCTKCGQKKDLNMFYKHSGFSLGRKSQCKECEKQYYYLNKENKLNQAKLHYIQNKEKIKEYQQSYNKINKDIVSAKRKEYYNKNQKELLEYQKIYRKEKHLEISKQRAEYRKTYIGKLNEINNRNRRRTAEKNGDVTTEQLKELYRNTKFCYWCNNKLIKNDTHLDHYQPISKGGLHTISNLVLSCSKCNLSKGSKDPLEFAQEKGKLL